MSRLQENLPLSHPGRVSKSAVSPETSGSLGSSDIFAARKSGFSPSEAKSKDPFQHGTVPRPSADCSVFDPISGGTLSPMSEGSFLSSAPVQAKKPVTEKAKMDKGEQFEELYRPLSQRTDHSNVLTRQTSTMDPELLASLNQKVDNMGDRFELLKQGGDEQALYDFMMKASSLSMVGQSFGDYTGDLLQQKDIFNDGIVTMMTDPLFASTGYIDYLAQQQNELSQTQNPRFRQANGLHGDEKKAQMLRLRADPDFYKYMQTSSAAAGTNMIEGMQLGRKLDSDVAIDRNHLEDFMDVYHVMWDAPLKTESNSQLHDAGTDLITGTYDELTAPVSDEQRQLLPKTITNYNTGLETKGTPAEKQSGIKGWLKKKFGRGR